MKSTERTAEQPNSTDRMIRVYVAGPYTGIGLIDALGNIRRGIQFAADLVAQGFAVYCPFLDYQFAFFKEIAKPEYQANSMEWLRVSHIVVLLPGWRDSGGTLREITEAERLTIPVVKTEDEFNQAVADLRRLWSAQTEFFERIK